MLRLAVPQLTGRQQAEEGWASRQGEAAHQSPGPFLLPTTTPSPAPGNRAARSRPRSLPMAFHTCQPPGKDIPISATMAQACARPQSVRVRLRLAEASLPP